jgi:hypothetical protein
MMSRTALLTALMLLAVLPGQGQTEKPGEQLAEPEFNDVFYRLDAGRLVPLERQEGVLKSTTKGFVVMSMKSEIEFQASDVPMEFVVRFPLSLAKQDPTTMYHLRKLTTQKGGREAVLRSGHASPVGASMNKASPDGSLPLEFKRCGTSSYRLITPPLAPGEYALAYALSGHTAFYFGLDK